MKISKLFMLLLLFIGALSCGKDDEPVKNGAPEIMAQEFEVDENISDAETLQVDATDPDGDELAFALTTDESGLFEITATGELSLVEGKSLDFETAEQHTVTITVSDEGGKTASAEITIIVGDIDENGAPEIMAQEFGVSENISDAETLQVDATDPDGDELAFALTTDESGLFEITATGELSLVEGKSLDFETAEQHTVTITVSDEGGKTASAEITIIVENVSDETPVMVAQGFEQPEDISDTETWQVDATDADGDPLIFGLFTNDNDLFEITEDGLISLAPGKSLDFETQTEHAITVSVTDGIEVVLAEITITVLNVADTLVEDPASFITKWEIPNANFELKIGVNNNLDYDFTIDWGDGTVENITNQDFSVINNFDDIAFAHNYETTGTYVVAIQGNFPAIQMNQNTDDSTVNGVDDPLIDIVQWGANQWETFNQAFRLCKNLAEYTALDMPDLSNVENMVSMFRNTGFNENIENWNFSNVKNMGSMFRNSTAFDQNLGNWNIENVEAMNTMLDNSGMSVENYSNTLIGWAANEDLRPNIDLGAGGLVHNCDANAAKDTLEGKGWTITDDGF